MQDKVEGHVRGQIHAPGSSKGTHTLSNFDKLVYSYKLYSG